MNKIEQPEDEIAVRAEARKVGAKVESAMREVRNSLSFTTESMLRAHGRAAKRREREYLAARGLSLEEEPDPTPCNETPVTRIPVVPTV